MDIKYRSTRGHGEHVSSSEAILKGMAPDGGLYVPSHMPSLDRSFKDLAGMDYRELSFYIISKFFTDFKKDVLLNCIDNAYDQKFDDKSIVPVIKSSDVYFIELFHGPTHSFKDMALTLLPHLIKAAARNVQNDRKIVILTATSGDTGKAALEGFSDVEGTEIIVFYPLQGVSKIQERQMITQEGENTHVIAVRGNFDDAQSGVKAIFADRDFNKTLERRGFMFSSANSINIGRLIPQIVYYVYSYLHLLKNSEIGAGGSINIVVPSGNFGNILAAYYSSRMGIPVRRLICASNINNVLYDFINKGIYDRKRKLINTSSPAMDILVSSNLERLLFDLAGQDANIIERFFLKFAETGEFEISGEMKKKLSLFYGGFATEDETFSEIKRVFVRDGYLIDTHTAVGHSVYRKYKGRTSDNTVAILSSTASPFKFPGSVAGAINRKYAGLDEFKLLDVLADISGRRVPAGLEGIADKKIRHSSTCSIREMKDAVAGILGI
jgi:threonine synthase